MSDRPPDADMIPLEPLELAPQSSASPPTHATTNPKAAPTHRGPKTPVVMPRECRRCGYDLSGLEKTGKCPECGFPVRGIGVQRQSDQLAGAPAPWLRVLSMGATALVVGAYGGLAASFGLAASGHWANLLVMLGGAGCYYVGVWLMTRARPLPPSGAAREPGEWLWSRRVARWTQPAWIAAALCEVGALFVPTAVLSVALGLWFMAAALLGLPAVMVYLARLALWANDDDLSARLRSSTVLAPVGIVCAIVVARGLGIPAIWASWWPFRVIAMATTLALLLPLLFSIVQLWYVRSMAAWAVVYNLRADDRIDRDRERAERLERVAAADRARAAEVHPAGEPTAPEREAGPSRNSRAGGRN